VSSAPDPVLVEALADEVLVACAAGSMHGLAVSASGRLYYWGLVHVSKAEVDARPGEGNAATAATAAAAAAVSPSTTGATADSVAGPDVNDRAAAGDAREMLGLTGAASETLQRIVRESEQLWLTATDEDGPAEAQGRVTGRRAAQVGAHNHEEEEAAEAREEGEAAAEARAAAGETSAAGRRAAGDLGAVAMGDVHAQRR